MEQPTARLRGQINRLPRSEERTALIDEVAVAVLQLKDEVIATIQSNLANKDPDVQLRATRAWIATMEWLRKERRDRIVIGDILGDDKRVEININISDQTETGIRSADNRRVLEAGARIAPSILDNLRLDG